MPLDISDIDTAIDHAMIIRPDGIPFTRTAENPA
jgi:hypothetical protein